MPKTSKAKKLVLVSAISTSMTGADKEAQVTQATQKEKKVIPDRVLCIYYPVQFWKKKGTIIWALINLGNEINAMTLAYAKQLGPWNRKIDIGAQKIDGLSLDTFGIVIAGFQVIDKLSSAQFF